MTLVSKTCSLVIPFRWDDDRIFDVSTFTDGSVPTARIPNVDDGIVRIEQTHRIPCRRPSDLGLIHPQITGREDEGRAALGITHPKPGSPGLEHLSARNKRRA